MLKKFDDLIDKIVDLIKSKINPLIVEFKKNLNKESLFYWLENYERIKILEEKTLNKLESDLKKIENNFDKSYCSGTNKSGEDCSAFSDEASCIENSGCPWLNNDEPIPSPYSFSGIYNARLCSTYKNVDKIKSANQRYSIISNGKITKIFDRKRYKSDENFEKAILKFKQKNK